MKRANYEILVDSPGALVIKDLGPWNEHRTVTNDVERVVEELVSRLGERRLFYFDSHGDFDEIVMNEGRFASFRPAVVGNFR